MMARIWTIIGIILCVLILIYLSIVARRAVDDELDNIVTARDNEESRAFLSPDSDPESGRSPLDGGPMTEVVTARDSEGFFLPQTATLQIAAL